MDVIALEERNTGGIKKSVCVGCCETIDIGTKHSTIYAW